MKARAIAGLALLILASGPGAGAVESPSGIDPRLRLDWDVVQSAGGRPHIEGYVYNDYMRAANGVRLLAEALDADGNVVDTAYGYVFGVVPSFNRTFFDVTLKKPGASYRIRVTGYEWKDGGPG